MTIIRNHDNRTPEQIAYEQWATERNREEYEHRRREEEERCAREEAQRTKQREYAAKRKAEEDAWHQTLAGQAWQREYDALREQHEQEMASLRDEYHRRRDDLWRRKGPHPVVGGTTDNPEARRLGLTDMEYDVLLSRSRKQTLRAIGEQYGKSPESIRQKEAKGLRKLRHPSRHGLVRDEPGEFGAYLRLCAWGKP